MGAGLDVPAQQRPARGQRQPGRRPHGWLIPDSIRRQQHPGEPDRRVGDREQQPGDQEPAERERQPGEPTSPAAIPPASSKQEHPQAREPEPGRRHPGESPRQAPEIGDPLKRIKNRRLTVRQVRSPAPAVRVPERQPPQPDLAPVELDPRLKLQDGIDQQPVERLIRGGVGVPKALRSVKDVRRAEDLAAHQAVGEKAEHQQRQGYREGQ